MNCIYLYENKQEINSKSPEQNNAPFKTYPLELEFDRHLEHIVNYQGMESGLPMFLVGELGTFDIFSAKITVW